MIKYFLNVIYYTEIKILNIKKFGEAPSKVIFSPLTRNATIVSKILKNKSVLDDLMSIQTHFPSRIKV